MCQGLDRPFGGCFEAGKNTTEDSWHKVPGRRPNVRDGVAQVTEKSFDPGSDILNRRELLPGGHEPIGRVAKVLVRSDFLHVGC
ncbi:hypothetical protein PG996_003789 [Apiospora saccharicola]|uniref:Uncharacterized protein n=1 Tax=Apiospora saccharicola TaxID=335842 RepID=A0ABR1W2B3_9PEZI